MENREVLNFTQALAWLIELKMLRTEIENRGRKGFGQLKASSKTLKSFLLLKF
jgi:hypothetical protein